MANQSQKTTPTTATATTKVAKPKSKRLKASFSDSRKNALVVTAKARKDGSWLVMAKHHEVTAKASKPGMVFVMATEALATAKFNEIVAMAEKAKWQRAAKKAQQGTAPTSTFDAIPIAA